MKLNSDKLFALLAVLAIAVFVTKNINRLTAANAATGNAAAAAAPVSDPVARGRYLVKLGGCSDCHTPKKMTDQGPVDDPALYLAGHPADAQLPPPPDLSQTPWFAATAGMTAWTGPWGISYAANITPDPHTGIGIWTEEMFIQAMRTGRHMGEGRTILPPMPWQALSEGTAEDLKAIYAYLKSIPAVHNAVPQPVPLTGPQPVE